MIASRLVCAGCGAEVPAETPIMWACPAARDGDDIDHVLQRVIDPQAAAGEPDVKEKLLEGHKVGDKEFKVHLDGYDQLAWLTGEAEESERSHFFYVTDDGDLAAMRFDNWKFVFMEQRAHGFDVWGEPFVELRLPKLYTLRGDPFERASHDSVLYDHWRFERAFALVPAQAYVGQFLQTFQEYPPRQKAASFSLEQVMEKLKSPGQH